MLHNRKVATFNRFRQMLSFSIYIESIKFGNDCMQLVFYVKILNP